MICNLDLYPEMELSVIIVNYKVKYFLEQCLYSVHAACASLQYEIIVVDNGSNDGSREYLPEKFPDVKFIWNAGNPGFGKACNMGLEIARGEIVLFLNPDTIVPEDGFLKCVSFIRNKEKCGALGVRMIDGSGKFLRESKRGIPTASSAFFRLSGLTYLFPQSPYFSAYYASALPEQEVNAVDVLAGAFLMAPAAALRDMNGFDEDYFMYGEDVDLCFRLKKAGYVNYYYPEVTIIHFKGESTLRSKKYIRHFYGAMQIFIRKHYSSLFRRLIISAAVSAGKLIAMMKVTRSRWVPPTVEIPKKIAVVATEEKFTNLIHLIKHARPAVEVVGRVATGFDDEENCVGLVDDIPLIAEKGADHFVFTRSSLSFKEMITFTETFSGKAAFLFHAENSLSIVGSANKDSRGYVIAADMK